MLARLRLSWGMKTLKLFFLPVLDFLEFGRQVIRYALILKSRLDARRAAHLARWHLHTSHGDTRVFRSVN
jgi:hypothetical protein